MTKKDYELIAGILNDQIHAETTTFGRETVQMIAQRFADALGNTNYRFDRERFLSAVTSK